uniref:WGS project CAEQ00000000 data, annotated contig 1494 n=1 Tax=Trypanosoma congolense (strain IL3000) TaxID=1068625 RepID=F9W6P0_TRYCI|nr:unnamed protein product [Trypanosoma congolense IL3000]
MAGQPPLHQELRAWLEEYRKQRSFNPRTWINEKCAKLNDYMLRNKLQGCVTNVSGGVDSAVVLMLCSQAQRMENSPIVRNIGVCQPICSSPWALERGLENIRASGAEKVVIDQTVLHGQLSQSIEAAVGIEGNDFARGQLRSYMRSPAVYYVAQLYGQKGIPTIVMGTGNMDEDGYLGYFCKAGDGVVDVQLISDLHKSEVFQVARELGVPANTVEAPPSADLWDGQTDEQELGFPYDFVELYTGWFVHLSDREREEKKCLLSPEALHELETYTQMCEKVHRRNAHKLGGIVNL